MSETKPCRICGWPIQEVGTEIKHAEAIPLLFGVPKSTLVDIDQNDHVAKEGYEYYSIVSGAITRIEPLKREDLPPNETKEQPQESLDFLDNPKKEEEK